MKIAHLCLSCFYIDGFAYQENELVAQNVRDGHDVLVIASTENYDANKKLAHSSPSSYLGTDGAKVIRIGYRFGFLGRVASKLRVHKGVYDILCKFQPDVILFHGLCGWELLTAAKYKKDNPSVRFFVDTHTDFNNSARGFFSKYILHYLYYRPIARIALEKVEKLLCVSHDTLVFARDFYGIEQNKLEFYPLGGEIVPEVEYSDIRKNTRRDLLLNDDSRVFIQSGKIGAEKKLIESLLSFSKLQDENCKFLIVGTLLKDIEVEALALINSDARIVFLGWKSPTELRKLLCAADFYVQPGTQSATMQMALCCSCAVILDNVESHKPYVNDNGWLVESIDDLKTAFSDALNLNDSEVKKMQLASKRIACDILDYKKLAARLYN